MTKNTKTISLAAIAAVIVIVVIVMSRDMILRRQHEFECGDGPRRTIDIRDFTTQYSGYSVELETTVKDRANVSTKVAPVQLQQLSEGLQDSQEFRKFVVAGYNSCAITKTQYSQYGAKFQALDTLAREINQLTSSPSLSPGENKSLASLIVQFAELARKAGAESGQWPTNKVQQKSTGMQSPNVSDAEQVTINYGNPAAADGKEKKR